jgi:hypothetical protein
MLFFKGCKDNPFQWTIVNGKWSIEMGEVINKGGGRKLQEQGF